MHVSKLYYEGERNEENQPSGCGRAKLVNGDRYEGTFRRGVFHGYGTLSQKTGHRFDGNFRKGHKHGRGCQRYPDGSRYDGDWSRGVRHGYGVYRYANQDVYKGNWCFGQKHGVGIYVFAESGLRLKGAWNAGSLEGPVVLSLGDVKVHGTWSATSGGLLETAESVFNFGCKYLLRGTMKRGVFDEYVWWPTALELYRLASLPPEPLPVSIPFMDCRSSSPSDNGDGNESFKCLV
ncbi:radial spoke head 1 homolog [Anopheles bellator]|uniref:radial spoke head 1 homolog n=1 Tax=Anopheles bellator TaxID=139047 RepID=UPI002647EFE8|nr:radial spoke head 1 homolog [Anopheles bellator]